MILIDHIEAFLARTGIGPAQFGRTALHDPRFVFDLRNGRQPRAATRHFVVSYVTVHSRAMGWSPNGGDAQRLRAKPDQPGDARSAAGARTCPPESQQ